jgi:hypothetical protein
MLTVLALRPFAVNTVLANSVSATKAFQGVDETKEAASKHIQ